jgi:Rieske Fe-S protein
MTPRDPEDHTLYPDGRPLDGQAAWRQDFPIDVPQDEYVARRDFVKFLVLTSGAFVTGQCWIGLLSQTHPAASYPSQEIARLDKLPPGSAKSFAYPTEHDPCLLLRLEDGSLRAFGQKCTHLSCAVVPELTTGRLNCPCHHGYFDANTGRPLAGPPRRPLPVILLSERDGVIYAEGVESRTV